MGCTSSRSCPINNPTTNGMVAIDRNDVDIRSRPSRSSTIRLSRSLVATASTNSQMRDSLSLGSSSATSTRSSVDTNSNSDTAEIFILSGGIYIVTGNRILSFTMNPQQRQQQQSNSSSSTRQRPMDQSSHQIFFDNVELRLLQSNLIQLSRLFDVTSIQEYRGSMNASPSPAASAQAVRSLPSVIVTDHDLFDHCNKECCICCVEYSKHEVVSKLPCGHLFHSTCVGDWLKMRNTCPMCRWELETDDPNFELGRIERMKSRCSHIIRSEH